MPQPTAPVKTADPQGDFHQRVWAIIEHIPKGRVVTYADVAHALHTRAYRAVGQALNRNPHAPQVPCHRVVASDGSLHGYAGGLARKAKLLRQEGVDVRHGRVCLATYRHDLLR